MCSFVYIFEFYYIYILFLLILFLFFFMWHLYLFLCLSLIKRRCRSSPYIRPGALFGKKVLKEIMLKLNTSSGALFENYKTCLPF